jgi:hypothetical protein
MKTRDELKPASYSPVYAALYPEFAEICRDHGYALAIHGSLQRDFDLVAVPWVEHPSDPATVIDEITTQFCIRLIGKPQIRCHGRMAWTVSIGWGECALDISFMPLLA